MTTYMAEMEMTRLNGNADIDTMVGGDGNDTYFVNHANDVVTETSSSGGTDLIRSTVSYTASDYVENLTLIGDWHINATGNNLNNTLNGNHKNNILNGESGSDTLYGHNRNDTLNGGDGTDITYMAGMEMTHLMVI